MLLHYSFESKVDLIRGNLVYVSVGVVSVSGRVGCVSIWMESVPIPVGRFIITTYQYIGVRDTVFQSPSVCGLPLKRSMEDVIALLIGNFQVGIGSKTCRYRQVLLYL